MYPYLYSKSIYVFIYLKQKGISFFSTPASTTELNLIVFVLNKSSYHRLAITHCMFNLFSYC